MNGRNYLFPIGAVINGEPDVEYECVDTGRVLAKMETANNYMNIMVLDACRNNPYAASFRSGNKGLASMNAPRGTIIAYSASPGQRAADGQGRNSPFTASLLRNIAAPGLDAVDCLQNVQVDVLKHTSGKQSPWLGLSPIEGKFYFKPGKPRPRGGEPGFIRQSSVKSKDESAQTAKPEQAELNFGFLVISSLEPRHAKLNIDGKPSHPGSYEVSAGEHRIEARAEMYMPHMDTFTVKPGETVSKEVTLKPDFGGIKVTSDPAGAEVLLDSVSVGRTPYENKKVRSGRHQISLNKYLWASAQREVTIRPGKDASVSVKLDPDSGIIRLRSSTPGAKATLNGKQFPLGEAVRVPPGRHKLVLEAPYYYSLSKIYTLSEGQTIELSKDLSPKMGTLVINTTPPGAKIIIDGKVHARPSPTIIKDIQAGPHTVEVIKKGHNLKPKEIVLKQGQVLRIHLALKKGGPFTNSIGMTFVRIPAGSFMMGSPSGEAGRDSDEGPQHRVTISRSFYMQTTEVTQAQWKSVMGSNPSRFKNCGGDCPVERVRWNDAQEFIKRLNRKEGGSKYRLPTEAEWEYAARAGSTGAYCFGDNKGQLGEYAWYRSNSGRKTHRVGTRKPNQWGLYDMHGNVWEWVQDWYQKGYYSSSPGTDPLCKNSAGGRRVGRGGSWLSKAWNLRSAVRLRNLPADRNYLLGFRVARITP